MDIFSNLRKRKFDINLGYSNFQLLSKSEADSKSLETRLENNRPRYVKQMKLLLESDEIDVVAKGATLRYSKKENAIALAISWDDGLSFDELPWKALPRGKRKASEALLLIMVQTEVELWP